MISVSPPPQIKTLTQQRMDWGDSALTAPATPGNRVSVVDKSKVDPKILEAAQGMETMFLDYMMKVMRSSVPKNEMDLDSPASDIYQGMLDSETAKTAAKQGGVGLADQLVAYLVSQSYTQGKEHGAPEIVHGGTHAGQPVRK